MTCARPRASPSCSCQPTSSRPRRFRSRCRKRRCAGRPPRSTSCSLRNTTTRARAARSRPEVAPFDGGYTRSFKEGVFRQVLHFDVASLYPSLLLKMGAVPAERHAGRLHPAADPAARLPAEVQAARPHRADRGTARRGPGPPGQLQDPHQLVLRLPRLLRGPLRRRRPRGRGHAPGPRAASDADRRVRETRLQDPRGGHGRHLPVLGTAFRPRRRSSWRSVVILPPGIELEFDGRYEAMFCYKAKNYALYDGGRSSCAVRRCARAASSPI